jgi:hypothetical protein
MLSTSFGTVPPILQHRTHQLPHDILEGLRRGLLLPLLLLERRKLLMAAIVLAITSETGRSSEALTEPSCSADGFSLGSSPGRVSPVFIFRARLGRNLGLSEVYEGASTGRILLLPKLSGFPNCFRSSLIHKRDRFVIE